jgi:hypothetical protein
MVTTNARLNTAPLSTPPPASQLTPPSREAGNISAPPDNPDTHKPISSEATPKDVSEVNTQPPKSGFEPVSAEFPENTSLAIPLPSLDEAITGVLKGPELEARLQAVAIEIDEHLEKAKLDHAVAAKHLKESGAFGNTEINAMLRTQHAIDELNEIKTLVQNKNANAVYKLQTFLQKSAITKETGSDLGVDNAYGPGTEKTLLERIRQPDSTYVDRDFSYQAEAHFVYQKGEIGAHGTPMEAQGNCGPASIAMVVDRLGGEAPTMQDIRKNASAITGNRTGIEYGLDAGQMEQGLKNTLGAQGITVETHTESYGSKATDQLIEDMRKGLAEGKEMILLTSNLESGSQGHYIVINEVKANGNIVVHDPQSEDGQNREYTPEELKAGIKARRRFSRLLTAWPVSANNAESK